MISITLEHVSYAYSPNTPLEKEALRDVSVTITGGKITGLIGHTGSGKSTFAQMLNGLLRPTSGKIFLGNQDIWAEPKKISQIRYRVGMVFQYPEHQLFEETVYKDIAYGPINMGKQGKELDFLIRSAAEFVGLSEELLDKSPFELSGGQQRRVAIAGVLAMDPEVLVLDEPAAGLDPRGRDEILGNIRTYQQTKSKTVILISHSMEDMARYSDELIVLKDSTLLLKGSLKEVFQQADIIKDAGLRLPQVTRVMLALKKKGLDVDTSVYTVEDAFKRLTDRRRSSC
ncbi:MAG TPA: energy-coupling factor transporter ATPase [Clostridiales bacterium]|jgi:energy-coupling factor transport system ATP-binding protein|nr:energy-coupling factor transporter ATPase [Clostridiales bacterium]